MSITAMRQARAKIISAQGGHPNAVRTLLDEADELLCVAIAEAEKPFGHVTIRRLSRRNIDHVDQYEFYPVGQPPYLDNVDECHTVYLAPQPAPKQEPVIGTKTWFDGERVITQNLTASDVTETAFGNMAQERKPLFKEFIGWAGKQGYDCANTCNSDTGEWICLNPMTADLWRAWQAAHGIKEQP